MGTVINPFDNSPVMQTVLPDDEVAAVRQRLSIMTSYEHALNSMKLEMEMYLRQRHPEFKDAKNLELSMDSTVVSYD